MPDSSKIKQYKNPIPTTDIIIEYDSGGKTGIVLISRKNMPYGLAIPGGFAELGLSFEENAVKEAKEETGLDVIILNPQRPLCVMSNPDRDARYFKNQDHHITSTTYVGSGTGTLKAGDDARGAELYTLQEVRDLIIRKRNIENCIREGSIELADLKKGFIKRNLAFGLDHDKILEIYLREKGAWEYSLGESQYAKVAGQIKP